ncbi:5-hydroxytryptamine receptor 3A-like [Centropristis striata]|uniref:5-hydroxytryptamine receptor 3A-like n=1 Tax=Centropristis striata TaxID=184440 RepID=UPI0027E19977|nr:5-hydroxytryptamine receptor 3A-like [Centropristis striata]
MILNSAEPARTSLPARKSEPDQQLAVVAVAAAAARDGKSDISRLSTVTEKDKALPSPYVFITSGGRVIFRITMVVVSTCKMEVYKFPFDFQSCNLSFKSAIHPDTLIQLKEMVNVSWTKMWTKKIMRTQSEWLFVDIKTNNKTVDNFGFKQSMLVYTITMKRRSVLYIANFLLPVLFFLCLDLASFLISDSGGEKLSFKVTVLLAITVMQLILSEILPSSSDSVPVVAVYCIGIFGLMMISLFETILLMYLMGKDNEADEDQRPKSEDCEDKRSKVSCCCKELKKWTHCARVCDVSVDEPPSELLSATKEGSSSELTEESIALEKLSDEMKEVIQLLNSREEAGKIGYWTRVAKTINKVFFISYVTNGDMDSSFCSVRELQDSSTDSQELKTTPDRPHRGKKTPVLQSRRRQSEDIHIKKEDSNLTGEDERRVRRRVTIPTPVDDRLKKSSFQVHTEARTQGPVQDRSNSDQRGESQLRPEAWHCRRVSWPDNSHVYFSKTFKFNTQLQLHSTQAVRISWVKKSEEKKRENLETGPGCNPPLAQCQLGSAPVLRDQSSDQLLTADSSQRSTSL